MLVFPTGFKIYLGVEALDMRKSFNGFWAIATERLWEDPRQGAVFAFTNKSRDRLQLLYWDSTSVWVLAKRLEKGRFSWQQGSDQGKVVLSPKALTMLLADIRLKEGCRNAWYER